MRLPKVSLKKTWPFHWRRSGISVPSLSRLSASSYNIQQLGNSIVAPSNRSPFMISGRIATAGCRHQQQQEYDFGAEDNANSSSCVASQQQHHYYEQHNRHQQQQNYYTTAARATGIVLGVSPTSLRNSNSSRSSSIRSGGSSGGNDSSSNMASVRDMNHEKFLPCDRSSRSRNSRRLRCSGRVVRDGGVGVRTGCADVNDAAAQRRQQHQQHHLENVVRMCNQQQRSYADTAGKPSTPRRHPYGIAGSDASLASTSSSLTSARCAWQPADQQSLGCNYRYDIDDVANDSRKSLPKVTPPPFPPMPTSIPMPLPRRRRRQRRCPAPLVPLSAAASHLLVDRSVDSEPAASSKVFCEVHVDLSLPFMTINDVPVELTADTDTVRLAADEYSSLDWDTKMGMSHADTLSKTTGTCTYML